MAVVQDRLSTLPDGVLLHILSLTESYKTAVVCSVLSKRWRTLYTELPCLTFMLGDESLSLQNSSAVVLLEKFQKLVSRALLVQSQNLETLSIDACAFQGKFDMLGIEILRGSLTLDSLNDWLEYAAALNVKNLSLLNTLLFHIPSNLFSCTSLLTLSRSAVEYRFLKLDSYPTCFAGFPHLQTCSMQDCEIHDLATFLDNCPVLQTLVLENCKVDIKFIISSESLLFLNIRVLMWSEDEYPPEYLELTVECPKLVRIHIDCYHGHYVLQSKRLSRLGPLLSLLKYGQLSENGELYQGA